MATELKVKPETSVTTIGRYRWVICGLLFFATTINYMDRQILSRPDSRNSQLSS